MNRLPYLQFRANGCRSGWNKWLHNCVKALEG